jgi:hypothetical protein
MLIDKDEEIVGCRLLEGISHHSPGKAEVTQKIVGQNVLYT